MAGRSSLMTLGWSSFFSTNISLAINLTLSGSDVSKRTFFKATIFLVSYLLLCTHCCRFLGQPAKTKIQTQFRRYLYVYLQRRNQDSNLGGPKFFVQKFSNIEISILEVSNNATYFDFINVGLRLN